MNKNKYKIKNINKKGFTLIETIIYVAIIGGVVMSFISFSLSITNAKNKTYVVSEVQSNARIAMNIISQTIREASDINNGASTFKSDPGVLSLSMADAAKNPTVINLSQDDGVLQITEGVGSPISITSDEVKITNLNFQKLTPTRGKKSIRVDMTVEYNGDENDKYYIYSHSLQTNVTLRK